MCPGWNVFGSREGVARVMRAVSRVITVVTVGLFREESTGKRDTGNRGREIFRGEGVHLGIHVGKMSGVDQRGPGFQEVVHCILYQIGLRQLGLVIHLGRGRVQGSVTA